jgi:hypothetical protein
MGMKRFALFGSFAHKPPHLSVHASRPTRRKSRCRGFSQPRRLMAASAAHSFSSCRPQAVHPPPRLQAPFASARSARLKKEDAMQLCTFNELMLMTREELCDLNARLERELMRHEAGSVARINLLASLKTIRKVMVLRGLHF